MKRGLSGLSLVLGIDKPKGLTSHDVVNRVRKVFGEKRVGHAGTLDPLATGVLPVFVGPACRLGAFVVSDKKTYEVACVFGSSTTTDDAEGEVLEAASCPERLRSAKFAQGFLRGLIGSHSQIPPAYSAIKVNGKKAYVQARKGNAIQIPARRIEIFEAELLGISEGDSQGVIWHVRFTVSKGTYIRSLARDIGSKLACPAHVGDLRRVRAGVIGLDDCISLDVLARDDRPEHFAIDPVRLLNFRFANVDNLLVPKILNGIRIKRERLNLVAYESGGNDANGCTARVHEAKETPYQDEYISLISDGKLIAIYKYCEMNDEFLPACVFSIGVERGLGI